MIFVSRNGEKFDKCESVEFEDEEKFRRLLLRLIKEERDLLLPPVIEEKRPSIILLAEEFQVSSGLIDLLGIDDEGSIYIVETKLYRSRERRVALAQAIDYASALWSEYSRNVDGFIKNLESSPSLDEETVEKIRENIENGGLKLIVAMDHVDEEMEKMISFLNEMCEFDVYALSLERYRTSDGTEIVIPRLFPNSPPTVTTASRKKKEWSKEAFFEDAGKRLNNIQLKALERIYNFSEEITKEGKGAIKWGKGGTYGTFRTSVEDLFGEKDIYVVKSNGRLEICFGNLYPSVAPEKTESVNKFSEKLYNTGILSEKITDENYKENGKQYPNIAPENWMDKIEDFKKAVEELIDDMRKYE